MTKSGRVLGLTAATCLAMSSCADAPKALPGHLAPCPSSPNCVSSEALPTDVMHYIEPLSAPPGHTMPNDALVRLRAIVVAMPRCQVAGGGPSSLRLTFSSRLFGFTDDVELREDAEQHVIQVRSASRHGWGDMGVNRDRVEAIRVSWLARFDEGTSTPSATDGPSR